VDAEPCVSCLIQTLNKNFTHTQTCRRWTFYFLPVLLFLLLSLHILNGSFTVWILNCVFILFWHQSCQFFSACTSCFRISACYCPLKSLQTISFSQEFVPVIKSACRSAGMVVGLPKALPLLERCHQYLQLPLELSALQDWPLCCLHKIKCYL